MDTYIQTALIILFLPLASYVLTFFFGEKLPRRGDWIGISTMAVALVLSLRIFAHFWALNDPSHQIVAAWDWFTIGEFKLEVGVLLDGMTAVMLVVVTLVSFLVHLFSSSYMAGDRRYARYFAFLGWFTFSMLGIVLAHSIFFLYIFWELVGVASYLLIGFFFHKNSAAEANKKAFLTNRVGDFGFWMGILLFFTHIGSMNYLDLFEGVQAGMITGSTLTWAGILLFFGCVGKSAQVPLHVWLPDAMEGPTPVSALIHAATMVAAGVYMTARLFPLFDEGALLFIAYTGAITAIFAATIAIVQTDIKKGLAYSTVSQLGYMVMAVGVGGVFSGMFHLTTHAFFKACLFLGSGAVIHAMHHEQDMRAMGGLRHKMPITFWTFLLSTIAISGVPPFAGFWSKDAVLGSALAFGMLNGTHYVPFVLALLAALITAFYMFRIVFLTFLGQPRDQHKHDHAHEVDWRMAVPLVVLGGLAVISGGLPWAGLTWFDRFVSEEAGQESHALMMPAPEQAAPFEIVDRAVAAPQDHGRTEAHAADDPAPAHDETNHPGPADLGQDDASHAAGRGDDSHAVGRGEGGHHDDHHHIHHVAHQRAMVLSLIVAGLGILLSWLTYGAKRISAPGFLAALPGVHRVLSNKYYFDEFYRDFVVRGLLAWNKLCATFDRFVVDGLVNGTGHFTKAAAFVSGMTDRYFVDGLVNATAELMRAFGAVVTSVQTGRIQTYFLALVSGLVVLILVYRVAWPS